MSVRILIVEQHELLAQSLELALRADGFEADAASDVSAPAVLKLADEVRPRVVLLELELGRDGESSLPLIKPLRELGASVVMMTGQHDHARLGECVEAGALGIVAKSSPFHHLVAAVKEASELRDLLSPAERDELLAEMRRQHTEMEDRRKPFAHLTARERQVLAGLCDGKSAETIAGEAFVSLATVRSQIRTLLQKLGVHSQIGAVAAARRAGWEPDSS